MAHDARERILGACERAIARAGIRGFRMQDVARDAGVSIGLLAYHFGDRDGLLQAALDHVTEQAADRASRSPNATTAVARLAALLCSEFGDDPEIRAGSTAWNELRALAVFEPAQATAVARSTAAWQARVRELVGEVAREHGRAGRAPVNADTGRDVSTEANGDADALNLTALVEGLSGRWLTGQLTAAEAQAAVRSALLRLGY